MEIQKIFSVQPFEVGCKFYVLIYCNLPLFYESHNMYVNTLAIILPFLKYEAKSYRISEQIMR